MNCPKCGKVLGPNAVYCGNCGATVGAPGQPQATQAPRHAGGISIDDDGKGQGLGYTWEVIHQGAFALAVVRLNAESSISAEAGAMVSMSGNIDLDASLKGGVFGALKRAVGGETAFVSTFTAKGGPGEVTFASGAPGDIVGIEMNGRNLLVQSGSYLAGDTSLAVETKFGGMRSLMGGEGLFLLQISGTGVLLVSSFGAIHRKTLAPGERYIIDTGHLVAWDSGMPYQVRKAARRGLFTSLISGEGLVAEFTGPGEVLMQTRNISSLAAMLRPYFPQGA